MGQVDIFYIHAPDSKTDIEETVAGVNEVHKLGLFKRFGLSNYTAEDVQAVTTIDSAQLYGESEKRLGELKAGDRFTIDTKWLGGWTPGSATKEGIITSARESIKKLGVKQVDIFYIHAPDSKTDIEETV